MSKRKLSTLLADLVSRLVLREDGAHLREGCALNAEERAFIQEHRAEVLALLRAPAPERPRDEPVVELTSDEILRREEEARERAEPTPRPRRVVMFETHNGLVPLRLLSAAQVRRFEAAGKLTRAEVIEWSQTRSRSLLW